MAEREVFERPAGRNNEEPAWIRKIVQGEEKAGEFHHEVDTLIDEKGAGARRTLVEERCT